MYVPPFFNVRHESSIVQEPKDVLLTESVHTRQTLSEMAKSRILMKLGWVDQLMGRVDHTKYFWPGVTLVLVGAHPNFGVTKKN